MTGIFDIFDFGFSCVFCLHFLNWHSLVLSQRLMHFKKSFWWKMSRENVLILRVFGSCLVCCVDTKQQFISKLEFTAFLVNIFLLFYVYFHRCFRQVNFSSTVIFNCHWFSKITARYFHPSVVSENDWKWIPRWLLKRLFFLLFTWKWLKNMIFYIQM